MTTAHPLRPTTGSLYVGDLDPSIQEETLNQVFKICGPISSIRVCRDSHTRASLGYAYVNFHNVEDAEKALNLLNYHTGHGGKPWRIMWSHRDPSIRKSGVGNIFIKNLHKDINQQQLYDLFSSFGNILSCKVALDDHGRSKGYGFIHFETKDAADKAIESTNTLFFENKPVYVGPFIPADRRQKNNPEDVYTNIYIKEIDETSTEEEFNDLVSSLGTTTSIKLVTDAAGKVKGFGFANYKSHEEAKNAVSYLNGKKFKSKTLIACRAMKKQEREDSLKRAREERKKAYEGVNLYIKNIDESFTPEKLQEEFSKYGQITSLKIMQTDTGSSKGFGFVCYANREQARKAIDSLSGQQFGNKNLYVANFQPKEERRQQLQMQHASRAFRHPYYPYTPVPTPPFGAIPRPYPPYSRQGYPQPVPYVGGPKRGPNKPRGPTNFPQNAPLRNANAPKRNQPQAKLAPVDLPLPLPSLQSLAALPADQRRQIIGDHLYQLILGNKADISLAGNLTGIILHSYKDHDDSELIALLEDANELKNQMEEAFNTLEKGRTQQ